MTSTSTDSVKKRQDSIKAIHTIYGQFDRTFSPKWEDEPPSRQEGNKPLLLLDFLTLSVLQKRNLRISIKHKCLPLRKFEGFLKEKYSIIKESSQLQALGLKKEQHQDFSRCKESCSLQCFRRKQVTFLLWVPTVGESYWSPTQYPTHGSRSVNPGRDTVFANRDSVGVWILYCWAYSYPHCDGALLWQWAFIEVC